MVDVPQHAAQIASIRSMVSGSGWAFADLFQIKPFTPYWLGYLLVMALSFPFGIVWAIKLVLAAALVLYPWSAARFCVRMGADPAWRWLLLMLPFGFAYQWGFLNFIVAAPFGFLFLSSLRELNGRSDWRACVRIALWLHFLFFAHVLITAFFCVLGLLLLASPWRGFREWVRRCLPVFTILPVAVLWFWTSLQGSPGASGPTEWSIGAHRLVSFLPSLVSYPPIASFWPGQVVGLFVLAVPFLMGGSPRRSWLAWTPFAFYVAWMLFFPNWLSGTAFVYQRFGIVGLPLYLIGFDRGQKNPGQVHAGMAQAGLILVVLAMIGWQSFRAISFNSEVAGYREVIAHAEPGKRMLMLAVDPISRTAGGAQMVHFGSWYQAEQGGLTEFNFARNWVQPLRYREDADSAIEQGFEWRPGSFDWKEHRGDLYDYLLVRYPEDVSPGLQKMSGDSVQLLARSGDWQLYGRK
jgi:hypothetical protein